MLQNFLDNYELYLSIAAAIISLIFAIIICIIKLVRTIKSKTKLQNDSDLLDAAAPIMQIAESFINYSGAEKKEYVLTRINQLAIENGISFNLKAVSDKIEDLIRLSKHVNYNNKTSWNFKYDRKRIEIF